MRRATENNLTAKDLAEALDVSLSTVYRLKRDGRLPYFQPGGKRHFVRFPETLLETVTEATTDTAPRNKITEKPIPGPKPKWQADEFSQ
ncbi:helix-turn-helix domain-containing protein [Planctopirus hydrillae]|uniref:Helix-turn-helix domain-containing protein n=1 Tax=Planctopirus hydrillae TaxID=1841610 RepID=A0A1C3ETA8_9PLAN|nr:helix-turn-helix domain-containing protein [Planctopirus hydrillae]ODA36502.1 hypothetical protein A6X21_02120 [Planctopirus hydrillae]